LNTRLLIDALAAEGYRVTLPVTHKVRHPLVFRAFAPGDDLVKGPFGLSEPSDDKPAYDPDIVFSPLAAFDRRGFRLGYGGGTADAALPFAPCRSSPSASPIPARKPTMCRSNA
jgi:5-formyltetrahydrofolate cyclo-ligase